MGVASFAVTSAATLKGDPEAQHYNPQIPRDPTPVQPDRYGVDPGYHYQHAPQHAPTPPPGGLGSAFPNPFQDPFATPHSHQSQLDYEFASQADPYARPYSTHPPEQGFVAPPPPPTVLPPPPVPPSPFHQPSEVRFATPAPDDHYLDPRYDPGPSPSSTRYKLEDEGVVSHDDQTGDIPLLPRHGSGYGGSMPGGLPEPQVPSEEENYIHYGRIPQRVPRRFKTTKKIQLRTVHLTRTFDCPQLARSINNILMMRCLSSFTHLTRSACHSVFS